MAHLKAPRTQIPKPTHLPAQLALSIPYKVVKHRILSLSRPLPFCLEETIAKSFCGLPFIWRSSAGAGGRKMK